MPLKGFRQSGRLSHEVTRPPPRITGSPGKDLLINPIRIRILTALSNQKLTTHQIANAIPDIPQTTLYRQISILVENGLIQVVEENPVRGTVERVFQLDKQVSITDEDMKGMRKQDIEQLFSVIIGTLLSEAKVYLNSLPEQVDINVISDGIDFNNIALFLNDTEYKELTHKLHDIILAYAKLTPGENRKRRLFSYIFIPSPSNSEKCC